MGCAHCGEKFEQKSKTHRCCSVKCWNKRQAARIKSRRHAATGAIDGLIRGPCVHCGKIWEYRYGPGHGRMYCSKKCGQAVAERKRLELKKRDLPLCKHIGCNRKATRIEAGLCDACYCQKRRTGSLERVLRVGRTVNKQGYVSICDPQHPLFNKTQHSVSEHRKVYYDASGGMDPDCYWCGADLRWADVDAGGNKKSSVVIDHLNENKTDNRIENLVASCNKCNRARGGILPFLKRLKAESLEEFIIQAREYHAGSAPLAVAVNM